MCLTPPQHRKSLPSKTSRRLENAGEVINAKSIQRRYHRQPPDDLRDQPKRFEVFRLHLPQQPISRHLAVFGRLTEAEAAPPETLAAEKELEGNRSSTADGDRWTGRDGSQ